MINTKKYSCGICKTTPDQLSHHKSHIDTDKHKDKRELFEIKLSKMSVDDLKQKYKTEKVIDIVNEIETVLHAPKNKKLKENNINNSNVLITNEMSSIIDNNNNPSNKEALRDHIHEIHNYLRNNGAGYGMNALKVFNIFYGLKKIEIKGLLDKVKLKKKECEFSYLLSLANENKEELLAQVVFGDVLQSLCDSELREWLFYEIPQGIRGRVFAYLLKEIDKIPTIEKTCNVLLSGKIYEYFIGRDDTAISELGAYFTDRHIIEYILNKLNPSLNPDNTIQTMIDMFGGSGGFTTGYIDYLNKKYQHQINWSQEISKVFHFDMNEDVIKSAGLEFFCLTGELPNMNNLKYKNSFTDEFNGSKFKYPLTNPPYGGDDGKKSAKQKKREKIKQEIKKQLTTITEEGMRIAMQAQLRNIVAEEKQEATQLSKSKVSVSSSSGRIQKFAKEHNLDGNDKESVSLMLLMDIVDVGGTAIGVLKEGVFFDSKYKDVRRVLLNNFNVREIISVPQGQFENTETKTSIIIFDNVEEKTSEVKFSNLIVEKYKDDKFAIMNGEIVIVENKDDIIGVKEEFISLATKDEILGNTVCSLNGMDYNKKKLIVGNGYTLFAIKDLCKVNENDKKVTKEIYNSVKIGDVNYGEVTTFEPTQKSKLNSNARNLVEQQDILVSSVRPNKDKILYIKNDKIKNIDISNFVFTTALVKLEPKDKRKAYFIYLMMYVLADKLLQICTATQYPRFTSNRLGDFLVPIPTEDRIEYWTSRLLNETNEEMWKQYIQELTQEALPGYKLSVTEQGEQGEQEEQEEQGQEQEEEEPVVVAPKKAKKEPVVKSDETSKKPKKTKKSNLIIEE